MKIEKIETEQVNFKPIKITLVIESADDLRELYFRYICDSDISPNHCAYNHNERDFKFETIPNDLSNKLSDLFHDLI
tara:strand:- start:21 stop:251 length:231 start_codon:yes stop_codon:yes gene_type:complete